MEDIMMNIRILNNERKKLSEDFKNAIDQMNLPKAISIRIKQDSINNRIMKCYDQLIEKDECIC